MSHKNSETALDEDPCAKEFDLSRKCLDEKNQEQCKDVLKNYEHCRYFWSWIESMRNSEGIKPAMPAPEDREQVKQTYLPLLKQSVPRKISYIHVRDEPSVTQAMNY